MRTLIGLFGDKGEARANIEDMKRLGVDEDEIGVLAPDSSDDLGGLSLSPVDLPGLGRIGASGLMSTYLTRATATHAPDSVIGALVTMGVPAEEAERYVSGVRHGYTLETISIEDEKVPEALELMREHSHAGHAPHLEGASGTGTTETGTIEGEEEEILPVVIEDLRVGKREIEKGGVRVRSRIQDVPVEENVQLREETVDVERRKADRPIASGEGDAAFKEREIEVTAKSEEPVVSKEARVVEEVVVKKGARERTETVRDTVRKTDVDVERIPYDASRYQDHYKASSQSSQRGATFDDYEPAYRFGHEMRTGADAGQEDWSSVEPEARTKWEKDRPGSWERFKDAIRHAWERAKS